MKEKHLPDLSSLSDREGDDKRSRVYVFENRRQLMQPHAIHDTIDHAGAGRFSHWGRLSIFQRPTIAIRIQTDGDMSYSLWDSVDRSRLWRVKKPHNCTDRRPQKHDYSERSGKKQRAFRRYPVSLKQDHHCQFSPPTVIGITAMPTIIVKSKTASIAENIKPSA